MKNLVTVFRIAMMVGIMYPKIALSGEPIGPSFVNKPWQTLSKEEKEQNGSYLKNKLSTLNDSETIEYLVSLLAEPKTCFLPEKALIDHGIAAVPRLREIARDVSRPVIVRAEILSILSELEDFGMIDVINEDPLLKKHLNAYDKVHGSPLYEFQKHYLSLRIASLIQKKAKETEKVETLVEMLEKGICDYLVRDEILASREVATDPLVRLLGNSKAPNISRVSALILLKEIADPKSGSAVVRILEDQNEDDQLRELAAITLGDIGSPNHVPVMQRTAHQCEDQKKDALKVAIEKAITAMKKRQASADGKLPAEKK